MSRTHEELPARPAYDSATAALLERIESLGVFGTMTVQKIPSWRVPADDVSLDGTRPQCGIRPDASRSHG